MKVCPNCESQYADSMRYCNRCGCELSELPDDIADDLRRTRNSRGFAPVLVMLVICLLLVAATALGAVVYSNRRVKEAYSAGYSEASREAYEAQCSNAYYLYQFGRKIGYDLGLYDASGKQGAKPAEQDAISWVIDHSKISENDIKSSGKAILDKFSDYLK